jgi:hypothetical protein
LCFDSSNSHTWIVTQSGRHQRLERGPLAAADGKLASAPPSVVV